MSDGAVVVVGRGLIGALTAARLRAAGHEVVTMARTGADVCLDLADPDGFRTALSRLRPETVILTHGPSDVTWIESNEAEAARAHVGTAEVVAEQGVRTVLVSTDNVFSGAEGRRRPSDAIAPANAYGRVKAAAERVLLGAGGHLVLRVSLVYGWTGAAHRTTYGQRCLEAAASRQKLPAPADQSFTPIHVDDVAGVLTSVCRDGRTGLAHLAGPLELSRFDFARTAYRLAGAPEALVRPCLRADTEWASRPRFSSLACDDFGHLPMTPEEGLARMLGEAAA
ncbi:sugar nucleotide-binding protein [Lentzea sp. NEAU-D13]|uniref:dTDP-4-dehydrorhamnose reductase n=1 Tax=Lentzea alba TaxID=2714351 RepID=A0A7C9RUN2_9PSEU|nr:sugar nucleotide-binding protein [Lentzea alba]NGY63147.1 sugar nucleotide-binding protein [Lentzea alba]